MTEAFLEANRAAPREKLIQRVRGKKLESSYSMERNENEQKNSKKRA